MRARLTGWMLWIILALGVLVGSSQSRFSPSHHDLGGGRLPVSDGAAWFVGSSSTLQGMRAGWVARRPLNVTFAAPTISLSSWIAKDPLVMNLQIKRILAYAAIAALVLALEGCFSVFTRLGIGLSLLAVLFNNQASSLSFLLGGGLAYTQGSEPNAFVVVVVGVACLVFAAREAMALARRKALMAYAFGVCLILIGCQMRPGTLLLTPLLIALFLPLFQERSATSPFKFRQFVPRDVRPFLLTTAVAISGALLLQQLAFLQVTDGCGAIGGNQGYSLYGLSQGRDWTAGLAYAKSRGLICEKNANTILKNEAKKQFLKNPIPALGVVVDNSKKTRMQPGRRSWFVLVSSFILLSCLLIGKRIIPSDSFVEPRTWVLLLGAAGWISMELFTMLLFRDSYLRPLVPYSVFPILAVWGLIDALVHPPSRLPVLPTLFQQHALAALSTFLLLQLLLGSFLLQFHPSLANPGRSSMVQGQFSFEMADANKLGSSTWIFDRGLPENYHIAAPFPASLSRPGFKDPGEYCVSYSRERLPDQFGRFGRVAITKGPCQP